MYTKWTCSDIRDYRSAQNEWKRYSKVDDILYAMCRKWPSHNDLSAVQSKVILIGRTFAAGLERKGGKDKRTGILETVANILFRNRSWLDAEILRLRPSRTLTVETTEKISSLHGHTVHLLREGTKSGMNFRSFVSKYLHFHIPIVPIFDSRALQILDEWYPWTEFRDWVKMPRRKYDPVYARFLGQFVLYFSDLNELKLRPTVKSADQYLIWSSWD
jgi:hypothetical protein